MLKVKRRNCLGNIQFEQAKTFNLVWHIQTS